MGSQAIRRVGKTVSVLTLAALLLLLPSVASAQQTEYRFERMWPTLQQPWTFNSPSGIAVDAQENIYVADTSDSRIQKFSSAGVFLTKWGNQGSGVSQFLNPQDVVVDSSGNVYVADSGNSRIQKFTSTGVFLTMWGSPGSEDGELNSPASVAADAKGNVYVADSLNNCVQRFTSEGLFLTKWGTQGSADGQFDAPTGLAVDDEGNVYVTDRNGHRLQKFTSTGTFIRADSQFSDPRDVALDGDGYVYVLDAGSLRVQKFAPTGEFSAYVSLGSPYQLVGVRGLAVGRTAGLYVSAFSTDPGYGEDYAFRIEKRSFPGILESTWGSAGTGNGEFNWPTGVAADADGNVYVVDTMNSRVQKFTPNGVYLTQWEFYHPLGVAVDRHGNVYMADTVNATIHKFAGSGALLDSFSLPFFPLSLAVDSDGYIYSAAYRDIWRLDSSGAVAAKWTGEWNHVIGIAVDANMIISVADSVNHCIYRLSSTGDLVDTWNMVDGPFGVAVDALGNVFATSRDSVLQFGPFGDVVRQWGGRGGEAGHFELPSGLTVDADGNVYVVEVYGNRVQKFRSVIITSDAKAVVVAGGGPFTGNNLWDATEGCANFAYRVLNHQGFTKDSIFYISSDVQLDLDNNGLADDVDGTVTAANLQSALTTWAPAQLNGLPTSDVVVYLVDHGGTDAFRLSETEILSSADLSSWLDTLQAGIQGKVIVVIDSCESGSLLNDLAAPSGYEDKRIVMTSTSPGESAYFVTQGVVSFSNYFWTQVFNGETVGECFSQASDALSQNFALQHPLLDDTGDGVSDEADGALAGATTIGNGTKQYWAGPTIGAVSPAQNLNNTATATLWADPVTDPDGVARVWAVIRPPDYEQEAASNPVTGMPSVELFPASQDSPHWEATASIFTTAGTYDVLVYARDRVGNTSAPKVTHITVTNPLSRKAMIVTGGDQGDVLWPSYEAVAQTAYNALLYQGYGPEDIYYLSRTGTAGVDGLTVLSNIQHGITTWGVDHTQDFTVYLIGPGTPSAFTVNSTEILAASQLDTWLDTLEAAIPGKVTILYDGSQSGTFLPILTPPTAGRRIVLASTSTTQNANFLKNGSISFSKFFWGRVLNGATTYDAWAYARSAMKFAGAGQLAQLDDSGDGLFLAMSDGVLSRRYLIGSGILLAGDDPIIGSIVTPQNLTGTSTATIWVDDVNTTGTIDRVYAVIVQPNGDTSTVDLAETTPGRYETNDGSYATYGTYGVAVYATDTEGNISAPKETTVTRLDGPDQYEDDDIFADATWFGVSAADGATQTHNFHDAGDADWVSFDVSEAEVTAGGGVTIQTLNIGPNAWTMVELYADDGTTLLKFDDIGLGEPGSAYIAFAPPSAGRYYVKVTNEVGNAGADTYYDLSIYMPTCCCGMRPSLSVVLYSASGGAALAGIPVEVSSPTAGTITAKTLSYGIALFPSIASDTTYTIEVNASGYVAYSASLFVGCVNSLPTQFVYLTPTVTPPILQVTPNQQTASATAGSRAITIANVGGSTLNWSATILSNSAGFASIAGASSGTGNASVTVNLTANETQSTRNAWVKVIAPGAQGSGTEVVLQQAGDTTPPVVTLLGGTTVTLNVGQTYLEPGATATDAVSGDRTANIAISGAVNTSMPGTYYLTYQAADIAGNVGSATRTVVIVGETPEGVPVGKWVVPVLMVAALLFLLLARGRRVQAKEQ